jgi:hypothetical protein
MSQTPFLLHRAPLRLVTARLRVATDPSIRFDPSPIVTYRASVELELLRADSQAERVQFRIDTGAGITQMSLRRADTLGVRIGNRRGDLEVTTAKGTAWEPVVVGSLKVKFPGGARVFLWDSLFFENRSEEAPPLLGHYSVFDSVRLTFDRKNQRLDLTEAWFSTITHRLTHLLRVNHQQPDKPTNHRGADPQVGTRHRAPDLSLS